MGASLADLDPRDIARLRAELSEAIAAELAYPPYFDYRVGRTRVRPIDATKRQEIAAFVQAIVLDPIAQSDVGASEVRRFLEAQLLRYLELNADLARGPARRRLPSIRTQAPRVAAEVQRGLVALAAGAPGEFGTPRPAETWAVNASTGRAPLPWQRVERGTALLQAALQPHEASAPVPVPAPAAPTAHAAPTTLAGAPPWPGPAARPAATSAWADVPLDGTAPLPALQADGEAPFAGLAAGSQTALFGAQSRLSMSDQPTGPQPIVGLGGAQPAAPRALPPDLLQLYGEYLRDLQPETQPTGPLRPRTDHLATLPTGPLEPPATSADMPHALGWAPQQTGILPSAMRTPTDGKTDLLVFEQLRHQLDAYIRMAARSYGVRARGSDPASAIDALRRSGHVDEADLRIAEGILAIADRVAAVGSATVEDYRQAFMLYLLYHRGRIGV